MDKFLTFHCMLIRVREIGVVVVGSERGKIGWPPTEIKDIYDRR